MFVTYYQLFFEYSFVLLAMIFVVSAIDELFMIASFVRFRVYKQLIFWKKHKKLEISTLKQQEQKAIAIMVACWQEAGVISQMLSKATSTIDYQNYYIFVGAYPNDMATIEDVKKSASENQKIEVVILDHDGPTTKSDNINYIWKNILKFEKEMNIKFEIFAIHDAEDNIPVYGLAIFNYLIPRKNVVQLPVLPIKASYKNLVQGVYMDEFAFNHLVIMRTREWLSKNIPTAGVGCGFSRDFMLYASKKNNNKGPLGLNTLTEDYELPLVNKELEGDNVFFDSILISNNKEMPFIDQIPAVRSDFPSRISSAIVQKSRWILGISLQGADHLGWRGDLSFRYMLFRDRKVIITNIANLLALIYLLIFLVEIYYIQLVHFDSLYFINFLPFRWIVLFNIVAMIILLSVRVACTTLLYGPIHGILAIPRVLLGNIINGLASVRALKIYRSTKKKQTQPRWDKTSHE